MSDIYTIRDDVSKVGLHRLHVLRMGKPIEVLEVIAEREIWLDQVEAWLAYEEEDTQVQHLRLYWRDDILREVV